MTRRLVLAAAGWALGIALIAACLALWPAHWLDTLKRRARRQDHPWPNPP